MSASTKDVWRDLVLYGGLSVLIEQLYVSHAAMEARRSMEG
jgi:hypothetical protein